MPRRVGDNEFSLGCRKVAVCDIDSDALFAFRAQTIGQEGQVYVFIAAGLTRLFDGFELVLENGFAVVEQSANEGRLTVIY